VDLGKVNRREILSNDRCQRTMKSILLLWGKTKRKKGKTKRKVKKRKTEKENEKKEKEKEKEKENEKEKKRRIRFVWIYRGGFDECARITLDIDKQKVI
jgi:hypothetical protein